MKVLVTGAKGMLGSDLTRILLNECEVINTDITNLDITHLDSLINFTREVRADIIINCAAYTNVDACETDQDKAFLINAIGARNLAVASNETGASLVHLSTDYIFDGTKGVPYLEHDPSNPLNVYGHSKLTGENLIKTLTNKYYIIRTQWLFGKNGKNFVDTIIQLAKVKKELNVVNDQFGSPTYTADLAFTISELIKKPSYGTYHLTNSEMTSWYGFACQICEQAGLQDVKINPCTTAEFPRPAKRPRYGVLENYNWRLQGYKPLRSYIEALSEYLNIN